MQGRRDEDDKGKIIIEIQVRIETHLFESLFNGNDEKKKLEVIDHPPLDAGRWLITLTSESMIPRARITYIGRSNAI